MNAQTTGSFIATLRGERGLTQAELAEQLMVSDKAISRWETGRGLPDIENLEALARVLDISMAELLQGKRMDPTASSEANEVATNALGLVRSLVKRRSFSNLVCGFLVGLVFVTLATVHLVSPITLRWNSELFEIEQLDNGDLIALTSPEITGVTYDVTNRGLVFVSAYTTRLNQLLRRSDQALRLIRLGNIYDNEAIYYYPGTPDDVLLYAQDDFNDFDGIQTLPRRLYNTWIVIGAAVSIIGLIVFALLRKRWYARYILRGALFPLCCTFAAIMVLWGHFNEVYDASFYATGILLVACALYALTLALIARLRRA